MMTTMFGRCCEGCACAVAGPDRLIDISAVARISAAHALLRQLAYICRRPSRLVSGISLSMLLVIYLLSLDRRAGGFSLDAAESEAAGGGIFRLGVARRRTIAAAIVRRAQVRTALDHLAWNPDVGLTRVVAAILAAAARVLRNAAGFWRVSFVLRRMPVGRPLPDIADHVVKAVTVRRERAHRRSALVAIGVVVVPRKIALPGVSQVHAARREFVAPCELGTVETAARREFPFGFGWQILAGPPRIGECVSERQVHDGMII